LIGRPQIGKTGVFLSLAHQLWTLAGKPLFTGPLQRRTIMEVEEGEDEDEEKEEEPKRKKTKTTHPTLRNLQEYPSYHHLKKSRLEKATVSPRYGDPNDKAVRDWYLKEGNTFPYPPCLERENMLMKRSHPGRDKKNQKDKVAVANSLESEVPPSVSRYSIPVYNDFRSKPLSIGEVAKSGDANLRFSSKYYRYGAGFPDLGTLLIRTHRLKSKWSIGTEGKVEISSTLRLPPIIIPSSGRAETALLDLSETIPEDKDYIQIVIIRYEERSNYARVMNHPDNNIDVFVMKEGQPRTIGYARHVAKKFGEIITRSSRMDFVFLMDDNISHWSGITLINDPCPLFGKEPNHLSSQLTDISLFSVLNHFSRDSFKGVKKFSIVGFSNFNHKSVRRKRTAYGRKHVYAAVLLNLKRLKGIDYNQKAWAMEDTDFNLRTNDSSGVIVRCMRYVAYKKVLNEGGVVPEGVPPHIQEPDTLKVSPEAAENEQLKKEVKEYKELLQDSNLRLEEVTKQNELERKQRELAEQREDRLRKSHEKEVAQWKELARSLTLQNRPEPAPSTSSGASKGSPAISVNRKRSLKEDINTKGRKARKTNN